MLKLENCNQNDKIPNHLYLEIKNLIKDAFVHDFNLIIEEFNFYRELPSDLQCKVCDSLFKQFKSEFNLFFMHTETGFQNQLIVNMYIRIYEAGHTLVQHGQEI